MPVRLEVRVNDGVRRALADGAEAPLAESRLADLPDVERLRRYPFDEGLLLFRALGGAALLALLDRSDDGVLLLACDEAAAAVPWEYAATDRRTFVSCDYGLLRLEAGGVRVADPELTPRLLVLCADPLEYPGGGQASYQLDFPAELAELERALRQGTRALSARRVAPTFEELIRALADGPALLHFSCHGRIATFERNGQPETDVLLLLEDECGRARWLPGRDLLQAAPRGSLRLVLLSACHSAELARGLVRAGAPVALGMQHSFPDPQSAKLAGTFYRWLSSGRNRVAEAARQARQAIKAADSSAVGLLVVYTRQDAWGPLALPAGSPDVQLGLPADVNVPASIAAPSSGLLGRNAELVALAAAFSAGKRVVTITGFGGMGKTALAAGFLRRFGWRFQRVLGVSFANETVDLARVCRELLERAGLKQAAQEILSGASDRDELVRLLRRRLAKRREQQARLGVQADPVIVIEIEDLKAELAAFGAQDLGALALAGLRERLLEAIRPGDLLLFDNYESVLTPDPGSEAAAGQVARLLPLLLDRGARLLLTSRAKPSGLADEELVPPENGLEGLALRDGARLFLQYSSRARGMAWERAWQLAESVARETDGYPLAIMLLAGAYDQSGADAERFLDNWPKMLAEAKNDTLDERHARFAAAVAFSLAPLSDEQRRRLTALAILEVPFFAEAAVFVWGLACDDKGWPTEDALQEARDTLALYTNRSLVQIDRYFEGTDTLKTYRFQPALRQELRRLGAGSNPADAELAAYGAWLAQRAYGEIRRSPALADTVYQSLPLIDAASARLVGEAQLWHVRRSAWLRQQFGELVAARAELDQALAAAPDQTAVRGALLYEMANIYRVQGELDEAMRLYRESLAIDEALKDQQGKSATLRAMADIYAVRGELDEAMRVYRESLAIDEALKDVRGKSATLHAMARIYAVRGELDEAMRLCRESLAIQEALKDQQGKSAVLNQMANISIQRGEWQAAREQLQEALQIAQRLPDPYNIAFSTVKLGQVAEGEGDIAAALAQYRAGLTIFEQLRMPREAQQVRAMIAAAERRAEGGQTIK